MSKLVLPPTKKMGNMIVFDLEGKNIKRKGVVEVVPIDDKKQLNFSFRCIKDSKTNIWYGIPEYVEQATGLVKFKRITIEGKREYNLEYPADAEEFAIVCRHPAMLNSLLKTPDKTFGKPLIKIYDPVAVAVRKLKDIDLGLNAVQIARRELSGEELLDFARVLGITTDNNSEVIVKQLVAEKAQRTPKEFMRAYHDGNRDIVIAFKRAESVGLITYTLEGGYVYKDGLPLGGSEIAAINKIRQSTSLLSSIDLESKELYKETNVVEEKPVDDKIEIPGPEPVKPVEQVKPVTPVKPTKPIVKVPKEVEPELEEQSELETVKKAGELEPEKLDPEEQLQAGPTDNPEIIPGGPTETNLTDSTGLTDKDKALIDASGGVTDSDSNDAPEE